ncbi:MAG: hypothetical protein KTR26_17515 [Flammeovirgaceae bacterium]|nr:hypothetical protein [Flammeovirgaceae bacterium]
MNNNDQNKRLAIFKRGDIWIGTYAGILALSILFLDQITIDVQIHSTYYVTKYSSIVGPVIIYLLISCLLYFIFYRQSNLNHWLTFAHTLLTIVPVFYLFWLVFGSKIEMYGLTTRRYYSVTNYDDSISVSQTYLVGTICFVFGQLIFAANLLRFRK